MTSLPLRRVAVAQSGERPAGRIPDGFAPKCSSIPADLVYPSGTRPPAAPGRVTGGVVLRSRSRITGVHRDVRHLAGHSARCLGRALHAERLAPLHGRFAGSGGGRHAGGQLLELAAAVHRDGGATRLRGPELGAAARRLPAGRTLPPRHRLRAAPPAPGPGEGGRAVHVLAACHAARARDHAAQHPRRARRGRGLRRGRQHGAARSRTPAAVRRRQSRSPSASACRTSPRAPPSPCPSGARARAVCGRCGGGSCRRSSSRSRG